MMCADAGLLSFDTVHVDATLIRADASCKEFYSFIAVGIDVSGGSDSFVKSSKNEIP